MDNPIRCFLKHLSGKHLMMNGFRVLFNTFTVLIFDGIKYENGAFFLSDSPSLDFSL